METSASLEARTVPLSYPTARTLCRGGSMLGSVADANWQIVGAGDYKGGGKADLVWYNASTGVSVMWVLDGVNYISSGYLGIVDDMNWEIGGE